MPAPLKPITYRGGLIRFQIPAHWTEEYVPEGGGTFYEPGTRSPALRLNVITAKAPHLVTPSTALDSLRNLLTKLAGGTGSADIGRVARLEVR
jgi:hypothetical protein